MTKLLYALALIIPLSAQEAKDDPFHASIGKETKEEEPVVEDSGSLTDDLDDLYDTLREDD